MTVLRINLRTFFQFPCCSNLHMKHTNPSQVLAIMSKKANQSEPIYKEIRYAAKGVPLNKLKLPDELSKLILLERYIEK